MSEADGNAPIILRKPTQINGIEVVAVETAHVPHPATGNPVPLEGGAKALLADGTEVCYCDDCSFNAHEATSVRSHRNATHNRVAPRGPQTPVKTIKAVLRAVEQAKATGKRSWAVLAAEALNLARISSPRGRPWTPSRVSALYREFHGQYPIRTRRSVPPASVIHNADPTDNTQFSRETDLTRGAATREFPPLPPIPTPGGLGRVLAPTIEIADWELLRILADGLDQWAITLRKIADGLEAQPRDAELAEKARKYDALMASPLMQGLRDLIP